MTTSTATRQACVSVNNPPLRGHLSAVAVVKFNESQYDGGSSVCGAEVRGLFKCSSVDAIWAAADRNRISSVYGTGTGSGHKYTGAGR